MWPFLARRQWPFSARRPSCTCQPDVRLCPTGGRLWRRAQDAFNDGVRAHMLRGISGDLATEAAASWPPYQRARAAYETHLAARQLQRGNG